MKLDEFYVESTPKKPVQIDLELFTHWEQQLMSSEQHDCTILNTDIVPQCFGVYLWINKQTHSIDYIGKSTGKSTGLKTRIIRQHLNPKYLEPRAAKHSVTLDAYQLSNPVYDSHNRIVIDKSAFRKNLARKHNLGAGEQSVTYICETFNLAFLALPDQTAELVKGFENYLIKKHLPVYNTQ